MKMMPYRTNENLINGVVITFINITEIKRSNEELAITSFAVAHSPTGILLPIIKVKLSTLIKNSWSKSMRRRKYLDCTSMTYIQKAGR